MTDIDVHTMVQTLARAGYLEEDARFDREYGFNGFTGERCFAVSFDDSNGPARFLVQLAKEHPELAEEMAENIRTDSLGERIVAYFQGVHVYGGRTPFDEPADDISEDDPSHPIGNPFRLMNPEQMDEFVAKVKAEVLADIGKATNHEGDIMPITVGWERGYSELHDYVDANTYGGMCDDGTAITLGDSNAMSDIVDEWLRKRGATAELVAEVLYNAFSSNADDTEFSKAGDIQEREVFLNVALDVISKVRPYGD